MGWSAWSQDVKVLEKKWRKKVKEARLEKESLRSELAGRLALLADRMTQLATKEARHESRQSAHEITSLHGTFQSWSCRKACWFGDMLLLPADSCSISDEMLSR